MKQTDQTTETIDTTNTDPIDKNPSWAELFEALLKSPHSLVTRFRGDNDKEKINPSITCKLIGLTILAALIFGLTLGFFSMGDQLWAAPLKTTIGIVVSALICLPSLYIFTALTGSPLKFSAIAQGLAATLALLGAILLGFAPVLWVFSQSTNSLGFMGALVLISWLIAIAFGCGFLLKMLKQTGHHKNTAPLRVWMGIFILVTLQMSTSLRPLIGTSEALFTTEKKFFLAHWAENCTSRKKVNTPSKTENYQKQKQRSSSQSGEQR